MTCLLEKPRILTGPTPGTWVKTWELPARNYGEKGDATFVLTNAAVRPWETTLADGITVRLGFARTEDQTGKVRGPAEAEHTRVYGPVQPEDMKRIAYGIRQAAGLPDNPMKPPVPPISIPKGDDPQGRQATTEPRYQVTADPREPIPLGYTGPFYGWVEVIDPDLPMTGNISSLFCRKGDERRMQIGRVLVAKTFQLKVHVQTDLCRLEFGQPGPFPVVDRLDAIVVLPFGWRYQKSPLQDEVTPGVQIFVDRFHARMEGRLAKGRWSYEGPTGGISPVLGGMGPGTGGSPGGSPGSGGTGSARPVQPGCDCSCEAFQKLQEATRRRDDPEAKALTKSQAMCAMQCVPQWTACAQRRPKR